MDAKHVVIIGGGFGGLYAARALRHAAVNVTLVDKSNHHLFQPLLYQVATAGLSSTQIAAPIRKILSGQKNLTVRLAAATAIDCAERRLVLSDGAVLEYDYLVLATGLTHEYFGHDEWRGHAPGLKTLEEAVDIRERVLMAFEEAEHEPDEAQQRRLMTFAVIGAGPTGVELAGAFTEIARHTLRREFRNIDPADAQVVLIEGGERVLPAFPEELSAKAQRQLEQLGVEVRLGRRASHIDERGVRIGDEELAAHTVVWAAGVRGTRIAETLGVPLDRAGRVLVEPDLTIPAHPEVYVVGDLAALTQDGDLVPGVAPAAIQGGRHAARCIRRQLEGLEPEPFRYLDKGTLATIGRSRAVAYVGGMKFSGLIAWMLWLVIHIMFLIGFRNRLLVLIDWIWAYITYQRGARIVVTRSRARYLAGQLGRRRAPEDEDPGRSDSG